VAHIRITVLTIFIVVNAVMKQEGLSMTNLFGKFSTEQEAINDSMWYRIDHEIGWEKKYDEYGIICQTIIPPEQISFMRRQRREDRHAGKERLYFRVQNEFI
jgi:hypothetical protein